MSEAMDPLVAAAIAEHRRMREIRVAAKELGQRLTHCRVEGVEVDIYQALNGTWCGNVLADSILFHDPDVLPKNGNRPRIDAGSQRWWWDESCSVGARDWQQPTPEAALKEIVRRLDAILRELWLLREAPRFLAS